MTQKVVLDYLLEANRPYSCADITVNLRGVYSKGVVQKALDALTESGQILCKIYGKQKVYVAEQAEEVHDDDDDVKDFNDKIQSIQAETVDLALAVKRESNKLKTILSEPTTVSAFAEIDDLKKIIGSMEIKFARLQHSRDDSVAEVLKKSTAENYAMLKAYGTRKRIGTEMLDAILEGYPKPKKTLLEELCIETDEMVNFKVTSAI